MEAADVLSKTNKRRVANLRSVAARYEQQSDVATKLGWTPSYLSQLMGPNPTRPISEKTARAIENKLGLEPGLLDAEMRQSESAVSADLLDNVMLTVDASLNAVGWKLQEEKYRALVSYLYKAASRRGEAQVDRGEVDILVKLVR